jgi:hypothetical protein
VTRESDMTSNDAAALAAYIRQLRDFDFVKRGEPYGHMGATITDAILQAGMRYHAQVLPRARRLVEHHPEAATSSGFQRLLAQQTPEIVVGIQGRKAVWIQQMTDFFVERRIETTDDLRSWLSVAEHIHLLFQLKGVGLKTANYLKLLAGLLDSVAVDTHIRAFLATVGIVPTDDHAAGALVAEAAAILNVSPAQLDASIWAYRVRRPLVREENHALGQLVVWVADVGSVSKGRFGWCRVGVDGERCGSDISAFADQIADHLRQGMRVAVGFECPLFVPVYAEPKRLTSARMGDGSRAWSASAGLGSLAVGLVECAWVFERLAHAGIPIYPTLSWETFSEGQANLLIWEAFVSNKRQVSSQVQDATLAARTFWSRAQEPTLGTDVTAENAYSLVGAALLWAGLSQDLDLLRQPTMVIKSRN